MRRSFSHAGILLALLAVQGTPGLALDTAKWSRINNDSAQEVPFHPKEGAPFVGDVLIKKDGDPSDGKSLTVYHGNFMLHAKTHYLAYFNTTPEPEMKLDMALVFGEGKQLTTVVLVRGEVTPGHGDKLQAIPADTLKYSNVILGLSGFRNLAGTPLIQIVDPAPGGGD